MCKKNCSVVKFIGEKIRLLLYQFSSSAPFTASHTFYRTKQCRRARYFQSVDSGTVRFRSAHGVTAVLNKEALMSSDVYAPVHTFIFFFKLNNFH